MRIDREIEKHQSLIEESNKKNKKSVANIVIDIMDKISEEDYVTLNRITHYVSFEDEIMIDITRLGKTISMTIIREKDEINVFFSEGGSIEVNRVCYSINDESYEELNKAFDKLQLMDREKIIEYSVLNKVQSMFDELFEDYSI